MSESYAWSRLREDWEVMWVKPTYKNEVGQGPFPHAYVQTRSKSLELLIAANVSKEQMKREVRGLEEAIDGGLLDDLEHDFPPAYWLGLDEFPEEA